MRLKYEKVIHHAIVNNLFGFGYTKKSCNAQGSSKYYLFVTAPLNTGLILLGMFGILPASTTSLIHNGSTFVFAMSSSTSLLEN